MKVQQRYEDSAGNTWTKLVPTRSDDTNSTQYRKSGVQGTVSEQQFHGGKGNKTADIVVDGNSVPDRDTEIPVPDEDGDGFDFVTVKQTTASSVGEYVARDDVDGDTEVKVVVDGEVRTHAARDLRHAYRRAGEYRETPVRYLQ